MWHSPAAGAWSAHPGGGSALRRSLPHRPPNLPRRRTAPMAFIRAALIDPDAPAPSNPVRAHKRCPWPPALVRSYHRPLLGLGLTAFLALLWPGRAVEYDSYRAALIRVCLGWHSAMDALAEIPRCSSRR